jgi:hypothetical protein
MVPTDAEELDKLMVQARSVTVSVLFDCCFLRLPLEGTYTLFSRFQVTLIITHWILLCLITFSVHLVALLFRFLCWSVSLLRSHVLLVCSCAVALFLLRQSKSSGFILTPACCVCMRLESSSYLHYWYSSPKPTMDPAEVFQSSEEHSEFHHLWSALTHHGTG